MVAPEVVGRDRRVPLARLQREGFLGHLDRAGVVAALAGDVSQVREDGGEPGRLVELTEESGALLHQRARLLQIVEHGCDRSEVAELSGDPEVVVELTRVAESGFFAFLRELLVAEARRDGST